MRRCLNCRRTYEDNLSKCPFCGYTPRTKTMTKRTDSTQEFDIPNTEYTKPKKQYKNIRSDAGHAGAFYLQSGEKINSRYSVINVMGFGAFGVAYECFDSNTHKNVVVKEYLPSYLASRSKHGRDAEPLSEDMEAPFEIGVDSFIDENKRLLDNEVRCVPRMIDCFKENNTSYVVTELVHGEALSSVIRRKGRLPYQATITIITGVLQGLRQLNKLGIIHGDICPENIIVTNDSEVYLLDYNLSDFNRNVYTQRDSGKLRAGYSALELYYMNMEQGPWTDVYAAAAVMYKMLTGMTVPSAIKRKTSDSLSPPTKLGVPITEGAEKAMLKALRVDYEKRTRNPEDFLNGLMGDGFDNVALAKEKNVTPSRSTQKHHTEYREPEPTGSGRVLNTILIFLIVAIIGVVLWLFIAGVFPLPEGASRLFGGSVSSESSDKEKVSDTNTDIDTSPYDADFYSDQSSSEESDDETDTDTDTQNLFDNIISRVRDKIESETPSSEPEPYYEEPYETYESSEEYYYYEEPEDTDYYSYDDTSSYTEESDVTASGIIEDITSAIGDVTSGAGEYINEWWNNIY